MGTLRTGLFQAMVTLRNVVGCHNSTLSWDPYGRRSNRWQPRADNTIAYRTTDDLKYTSVCSLRFVCGTVIVLIPREINFMKLWPSASHDGE